MNVTIEASRKQELEAIIKRINKKLINAKKAEITVDISADYIRPVDMVVTDGHTSTVIGKIPVTCCDVVIDDNDIIINDGWTVVAKVDNIDDNGNNIVQMINNDYVCNPAWYTMQMRCEHCKTNRKRKTVYIVTDVNGINGNYKSIGSTCLQDYTGINPAIIADLMSVNDIMISQYTACNDDIINHNIVSAKNVVALAIAAINKYGYKSTSEPCNTRDYVVSHIGDDDIISDNDKLQADNIIAWIRQYTPNDNNFERNVVALCNNDYINIKYVGYLVYLPHMYTLQMQKRRTESTVISVYYDGNIGDKIICHNIDSAYLVTILSGAYGDTYLYKFTADKYIFTWYASKKQNITDVHSVSGTIKKFEEYGNERQTVLTRCKLS